jgi:hypothetical protein
MNKTSVKVGSHVVTLEPDAQIVRYEYRGDTSLEDARQIATASDPMFGPGAPVYALCDVSAMGSVSAEARRYFIDWMTNARFAAIVCFGGGITARTIGRLVSGAFRLLRNVDMRIKFFASEEEALAFISSDRSRSSEASGRHQRAP